MVLQQHSVDDGWGDEDNERSGSTDPFLIWFTVVVVGVALVVWIIRRLRNTPEGE